MKTMSRIGELGNGRLILRSEGISIIKKFDVGRLEPGGSRIWRDSPVGLSLELRRLRILVHSGLGLPVPTLSFFDEVGELRLMIDFPELVYGSDKVGEWMEKVGCRRLDGEVCPLWASCAGWDDLLPSDDGPEVDRLDSLEQIACCGMLEVRSSDDIATLETEFRPALIDTFGQVVRLSDRPRTQVCYAHLGRVRIEAPLEDRLAMTWAASCSI